jgi:hypothetical protein
VSARKRIQPRRVTRVGTLLGAFLLAPVGIVVPAGPAQAISVPDYRYLCDREPPDVHHVIELIFHTGNDDLRGNNFQGNNNLDIAIVTDHQPSGIVTVANQGDNWPNNSRKVIHICVTNFGITPDNLSGVRPMVGTSTRSRSTTRRGLRLVASIRLRCTMRKAATRWCG